MITLHNITNSALLSPATSYFEAFSIILNSESAMYAEKEQL
jgi:hypothetical protein